MKVAAIYARVSSEKQKDENTIASQTAALVEFAANNDFSVSGDCVIEDAGFSGATLVRPGLEKLRDLAAEGQIQAVLIHSPDRLSRKYAYQVLLTEELARHGAETVFLKAPQTATPEDQLMVQFQGMIAEYERAQILERSRRGKRHRAQQGQVSVLSGAPYGYRYMRKTDDSAAYYEVIEAEAAVVRMVYERYTTGGMSIGAITRLLNDRGVPTRKQATRWERSVTWAMLRNPAYKGTAYFGKTRIAQRQRITTPLRRRGCIAQRNGTSHERPQSEWIEIAVPAIISEETFALAQELLQRNKDFSLRRTIVPSIVQGLVSCKKCGYALSRTSSRSSTRMIHYYYRCIGSEAWRHLGGRVCDSRAVRQDVLDEVVWAEVVRLLEDPTLITEELERRLVAAKDEAPSKRREDTLNRELVRIQKSMERLTTAYQEDLMSLDELRQRLQAQRQREAANRAELQSITDQIATHAAYLRLAHTLTVFLARLRESADTLNVAERQRIVRLLVKEVLVGDDTLVIRHSIPVPGGAPDGAERTPPTAGAQRTTPAASVPPATAAARLQPATPGQAEAGSSKSYLLRSGRHRAQIRTKVFTATHALVDKAAVLVVEDLSRPIVGYDRGKNMNRRLSGWIKGLIQEAATAISRRRGASVDCVNAAYTSQVVRCHPSFGRRAGDKLHCTICKAVYDVDKVAAENILDRRADVEIGRCTPYRRVRAILEARFRQVSPSYRQGAPAETAQPRLQLGRTMPPSSTESEIT